MSAYSFPKLPNKKIIGSLSELGIRISEEVLLEPNKHVGQVSEVFEKLVEITTGLATEEMSQPAFVGLAMLRHPELHDENISFMAFFRAVRKMMQMSRIEDFSLKDFSDPKRLRLRVQLSAVINFCRFQVERNAWYQELLAKNDASAAAMKAAQVEHNELLNKIESIKEQNKESDKVVEEVGAECRALSEEIAELYRAQDKLRDECTRSKQDNHAAKDKVAKAVAMLKQAEVERDGLQGQIVSSPQRLLREAANQKQALEQELADVAEDEGKGVVLEKAAQTVQRAKRDLQKANAAVEELTTELNKQEVAYKEVRLTHRKIVEKRDEYSVRASEVVENQRKLNRFEEKLSHLQRQAVVKSEGHARDLEAVRLGIQQAEENWKQASARLKAREPVLAQLTQEKENIGNRIELQKREGKNLLQNLGGICRSHSEGLLIAMKEGSTNTTTTSSNIPGAAQK